MQKYEIFKRSWWKVNPAYPGGLEPHLGRKTHVCFVHGLDKARTTCEQYNATDAGVQRSKTGLKFEFRAV